MLKQIFSDWQNVVFTDETRARISSDLIFRVIRRNETRFLLCAITSDGQKMPVKCPNMLKAAGYLDFLKKNDEKIAFSLHYFSTRQCSVRINR